MGNCTAIFGNKAELLFQSIEKILLEYQEEVLENVQNSMQCCSAELITVINLVRDTLRIESDLSQRKADIASALSVAESSFYGSGKLLRSVVLNIVYYLETINVYV